MKKNCYPIITCGYLSFVITEKVIPGFAESLLKQICDYRKGYEKSKRKLEDKNFVENAPSAIVKQERDKLKDFENNWYLASLAYANYNE